MAATMAAEDNEDQWLYGSSNPPPPEDTPMTEPFSAGNGGKIGDIDGVNPVSRYDRGHWYSTTVMLWSSYAAVANGNVIRNFRDICETFDVVFVSMLSHDSTDGEHNPASRDLLLHFFFAFQSKSTLSS